MTTLHQEYQWYLTGCERLNYEVLPYEAFSERWQEFEDFAERLKSADEEKTLHDLDSLQRSNMQKRVNNDPYVRAVLVGMAESAPS